MSSEVFTAPLAGRMVTFELFDDGLVELDIITRQHGEVVIDPVGLLRVFATGSGMWGRWVHTKLDLPVSTALYVVLEWFQGRFADVLEFCAGSTSWDAADPSVHCVFFRSFVERVLTDWPRTTWASTVEALRSGQLKAVEEENSHVQV